jgi:hypothetical protein
VPIIFENIRYLSTGTSLTLLPSYALSLVRLKVLVTVSIKITVTWAVIYVVWYIFTKMLPLP